ncbi:hypothetical protein COT62_02320 [Candidatus Roizmanbacteria bacterium CG09_land_8_20_14_0_10_41_9]|uniref:DUF5666 domain-containing protein n=1 Tax=Candidatus Roizmanbacteria bacterium CG09_land_8_20_14_0_10_41_9 TaxID=1974850 RepID=A0A2H0WSV7_9BACT|nr:MAG: hypothetical protein COT62_02320 [Candidatus Roizmanbacteria bacterium CG09_land_8_20_14_0_10_41_9]
MKNNLIITIIVAVVFGLGGFFVGKTNQKDQPSAISGQFGEGQTRGPSGIQTQGTRTGTRTGNGQVMGEIINQDGVSITVKLQDGSTKIILYSAETTFSKTTEGSKSDLKVGERVGVSGTENSDGSVTAKNIQLNPIMRSITGSPPKE